MIRILFLVSAVFILSDCAASRSGEMLAKIDVNELAIHCSTEVPTGSHLPIRVCRSKVQIEQEREQARRLLRNAESKRIRY